MMFADTLSLKSLFSCRQEDFGAMLSFALKVAEDVDPIFESEKDKERALPVDFDGIVGDVISIGWLRKSGVLEEHCDDSTTTVVILTGSLSFDFLVTFDLRFFVSCLSLEVKLIEFSSVLEA